jgi:hypothetical protein
MNLKNVTHWKTTSIGLLMLVIAYSSSVKFDVAGHLAMTEKDWFVLGVGIVGALVGAAQKDAQ